MSQPTQNTELREFLIFARRLALEFAKWVEVRYIRNDGQSQTPAPQFEGKTSTTDIQVRR